MRVTQPPGFTQRVAGGDGGLRFMGGPASGGSLNFDFTTGTLPGAITFTRPSIGTYTNNAGTLITAGNDVARFNYVGGVACLLIEPAAANLATQSNNLSAGVWVPLNSAVATAAQFVSPDGTNNGWSVTSGSGFGALQQNFTFANVPYTISAWAKRIVGTAPINFRLGSANGGDLTTSSSLTRLLSTLTPPAGLAVIAIFIDAAAGNTDGLYGVQLETGSAATSYIPTTTTAVTRAADSAVFTIPAGIGHLTYTFDDNSTQLVAVSAGSYTVPTSLNRRNIKSIVGSA